MSSIPYIREGSSNVRMPKDYGYVYAQVNEWASLEDLVDPKEGDIAYIRNLPTGGGGGLTIVFGGEAIYTGGSWKLRRAQGLTKAALDAYLDSGEYDYEAIVGCIGVVHVTPFADASSKYYYWTGSEWLRTPDGTGYIHPNVGSWDFLPSGNVQDEDQVFVNSLDDAETSNGIAKWSESDEEWKLQEVTYSGWNPYTFSTAFAGTITNGAIIRTDDGSWEAPLYFWNTAGSDWIRSPENVNYLWPQTILGTWASLNTDGKLNADRISVPNWTAGGSDGVAQYDGSEWKLVEGVVDTIANLLAFTGEKEVGAKVTVGTGIAADPVYFWSGTEWLRTADQSRYIWPQVNNWSLLAIDRPHAINNDEVPVHTLGTDHSSGTAQKHGGGWWLIEGKWASVTDMNGWSGGTIKSGAIGLVDASNAFDANATSYFYTGSNWVRMAEWLPGTFAITSLQDFSGVGLKEGDYGILTPVDGAPIIVRYKAAVTIASGAGGGSTPMWLPPVVYAGAPEIKAYLIGTETPAELAPKGWTTSTISPGTITTTGGYVQLFGPTGSFSQAAITAPAITAVNKFYLVGDFRGTAGGSDPYLGIFSTIGNPVQYALARGASSGVLRQFILSGGTWVVSDTASQVARGGRNLPTTTASPVVIQALSSSEITELVESRIDGELYSSYRRNFNGAVTTPTPSSYSMQILANGGGGGTTATLQLKNLYYLTY
jgi:hypothetical protein